MTEEIPDLSKLDYEKLPNFSARVERHIREVPDGLVSKLLNDCGVKALKATPTMLDLTQQLCAVKQYIDRGFVEVSERLAALEAAPSLRDGGVWNAATSYTAGAVVTDHGSAWVCKSFNTGQRPGSPEGSGFWRLLVKRGRDARDKTA